MNAHEYHHEREREREREGGGGGGGEEKRSQQLPLHVGHCARCVQYKSPTIIYVRRSEVSRVKLHVCRLCMYKVN